MSGFRVLYEEQTGIAPRQRRPRVERSAHLDFIRALPCVICGSRPVDPAHLRTANRMLDKREVGVGERPDDRWCTSLCRTHHTEQHNGNELAFWVRHGIGNPWQLCLALYAVTGDIEAGEAIIRRHQSF